MIILVDSTVGTGVGMAFVLATGVVRVSVVVATGTVVNEAFVIATVVAFVVAKGIDSTSVVFTTGTVVETIFVLTT